MPTAPKWLRFSLRTLLVVMLVVASFFGGRASMLPTLRDAQREAEVQRAQAAKHRRAADQAQYVLEISLAQKAIVERQASLLDTARLLESIPPDSQEWQYYYLRDAAKED